MKRILAVAIAACCYPTAACVGAYMPAPSRHYSNKDYEFSVEIPTGLPGCVSKEANNGVDILLDHRSTCDSDYGRSPYIDISANYNAAGLSDTPAGLAKIYCGDDEARRVTWLKGWSLGGRAASGCRQRLDQGIIRVNLMTLRKTDLRNPEVWIKVSAQLTTTASRYASDMRQFRKIVRTVRIARDGPLK